MRVLVVASLLVGCYDVPLPQCGFVCGPAEMCPDGYGCHGGRCIRDQEGEDCTLPITEDPTDTTAPRVTALSPTNDETDVELDAEVLVTFSEDVLRVSSATFGMSDGTSSITGVVAPVGAGKRAFRFTPLQLRPNQVYEMFLGGGITDLAGNLLPDTRWSFSTQTDLVGPRVTGSAPANNATDVSTTQLLFVGFDEDVVGADETTVQLWLEQTLVPTTVSIQNTNSVQIAPAAALASESTYRIEVSSGITDVLGNAAMPATITFTTRDSIRPTIISRMPAMGATGVPTGSVVTVVFDDDMVYDGDEITIASGAATVSATGTYDPLAHSVTLVPTTSFAPATTHTITVAVMRDDANNALTPESWTFTTAP